MTVGDLIERLGEYPPHARVLLALRPEFPFAHRLGRLVGATAADGAVV